jgi:transposase
MGKIKTIVLSEADRQALEKGYREGASHCYRLRCQMILLKSEARPSLEIAEQLGYCEVVVNNWLKRYQAQGLQGLATREGRGRKPILDSQEDIEKVKAAVQKSRQRISLAKAELQEALGKQFSQKTLERYIKNMVGAINASENVRQKSRARKSTS